MLRACLREKNTFLSSKITQRHRSDAMVERLAAPPDILLDDKCVLTAARLAAALAEA
jgi:hypothetical protein